MISMARIFGAPVIEPPGKVAAMRSTTSRPGAQAPGDHRGEVMDRGIGLDAAQRGHRDAAGLADPRQVVAQQVDDHDVLGAVLLALRQSLRAP